MPAYFSHERPTLIMLLHPKCSCSRASLNELAGIIDRFPDQLEVAVIFIGEVPKQFGGISELRKLATALNGVKVIDDFTSRSAIHLDSFTSGHSFLYDVSGKLLFSGGITPGRGHVGMSQGRSQIENYLLARSIENQVTPVFGCELTRETV